MNKEDIINYVMTTPGNPNRAVLNGMLDSMSGGSSDNMAILPKLTVTLNIDNIEHIDTYGIANAVELNNGIITIPTFNPPQTSQVWEGYIFPLLTDSGILWIPQVFLFDESYTGYYQYTISNMINCVEDSDNPGTGMIRITDPTKPASCTINAVYTLQS